MLDIEDRSHKPGVEELAEFVGNPLFNSMCAYMIETYQAIFSVEYSGDKVLQGWNLKFKKCGRTLFTVYPRVGCFELLVVVGRGEKERVEAMLPACSDEFRRVYAETGEGMGQRWLLFHICDDSGAYGDALRVARLRRERG